MVWRVDAPTAELYLERISEVDKNGPYINSVIEVNRMPRADA
jgi:hypothetical protein